MRWDAVLQAAQAAVLADPALVGIFGEAVRLAGSGSFTVPLLEARLIADSEGELWAPCLVQWDIWTPTLPEQTTAERRLRTLFHRDLPATLGGVFMFSQYEGGDFLSNPDRDGVHGRAVRFRHTPLRAAYA